MQTFDSLIDSWALSQLNSLYANILRHYGSHQVPAAFEILGATMSQLSEDQAEAALERLEHKGVIRRCMASAWLTEEFAVDCVETQGEKSRANAKTWLTEEFTQ